MSYGTYAVVKQDGEAKPGVLFFLRQTNDNPTKKTKPQAPSRRITPSISWYDGTIRYGCASARRVLEVFEAAAYGVTEPIQRMCDLFNRETDNGQRMCAVRQAGSRRGGAHQSGVRSRNLSEYGGRRQQLHAARLRKRAAKTGRLQINHMGLLYWTPEHERYQTGHDA